MDLGLKLPHGKTIVGNFQLRIVGTRAQFGGTEHGRDRQWIDKRRQSIWIQHRSDALWRNALHNLRRYRRSRDYSALLEKSSPCYGQLGLLLLERQGICSLAKPNNTKN